MSSTPDTAGIQADYMSYLLRLWRISSTEGHAWRASLNEPVTQEVFRFEDLQSLFEFLRAQTGQDAQQGDVGR